MDGVRGKKENRHKITDSIFSVQVLSDSCGLKLKGRFGREKKLEMDHEGY